MEKKTSDAMAMLDNIAERIDRAVKNLPAGECEVCRGAYKKYDGSCRGYTWDVSYFSENRMWDFSLRRHGQEVWHKTVEGSIVDCLFKAMVRLTEMKREMDGEKRRKL